MRTVRRADRGGIADMPGVYEGRGSVPGGSRSGGGIAGHCAGAFDHSGNGREYQRSHDGNFEHCRQAGKEGITVEFIRFIFSSFWIWLGFTLAAALILNQTAELIKAIRPTKHIDAYRIGDRWHFQIERADKKDIEMMMKQAENSGERGDDE